MFVSKKRFMQMEKRIEKLERACVSHSYKYGMVSLNKAVKILERHEKEISDGKVNNKKE